MLRLIQPGKPTPNGFIESINGRFHDECLNEHCSAISFRLGNSLNDIAPAEFIRGLRKYEDLLFSTVTVLNLG